MKGIKIGNSRVLESRESVLRFAAAAKLPMASVLRRMSESNVRIWQLLNLVELANCLSGQS